MNYLNRLFLFQDGRISSSKLIYKTDEYCLLDWHHDGYDKNEVNLTALYCPINKSKVNSDLIMGISEYGIIYRNNMIIADQIRCSYWIFFYCVSSSYLNMYREFRILKHFVCFSLVLLVSVPFLLVTILIYVIIPQLWNFIGKCIVFHLASLLYFFTVVAYVKLNSGLKNRIDDDVCTALGYMVTFSARLAFAWSNVISFDLYSSFQ